MDAAIGFTSIGCSTVACIQSVSIAINYHITATMDAGIIQQNWMQVLDADKLLTVMDAASISASKVFQVPAIIVMKQKQCRHICSQTEHKFRVQTNIFPVLDAA